MNIREELKTFSGTATRMTTSIAIVADNLYLRLTSPAKAAFEIDRLSRDLANIAGVLKDLAYTLSQGIERDAKVVFPDDSRRDGQVR